MYAFSAAKFPVDAVESIDVCQNVKVPGDGWGGYRILSRFFYPPTPGSDPKFNRSVAARLRRALSIVLESVARSEKTVLSDAEADALQEKIYLTVYPGGNMDISSGSEDEYEDDEDDEEEERAFVVGINRRRTGANWENLYRVDFGGGDRRDLTKYELKQEFSDDWKDMVASYKEANDKDVPARKRLEGRIANDTDIATDKGGIANARAGGGVEARSRHQRVEVELDDGEVLGDSHGVPGGNDTSPTMSAGDYYDKYDKYDKPLNGSTMVDSTDNGRAKKQLATRELANLETRNLERKHRMSEPVNRTLGIMAHRDIQLERLTDTGPSRKRQRLGTPLSAHGGGGFSGYLARMAGYSGRNVGTPLTGERDLAHATTHRTDTASLSMEFMSIVLQNEEALKAEIEELAAENKHLRGLVEDEELALDIADDDDVADAKRERRARQRAEEVLRAREQELRTVKGSLKKLQNKNGHTLKDLERELEEWQDIAAKAQDDLEKQVKAALDAQNANVALQAENAGTVGRLQGVLKARETELSRHQEAWGKALAVKSNESEHYKAQATIAYVKMQEEQKNRVAAEQKLQMEQRIRTAVEEKMSAAQRELSALQQKLSALQKASDKQKALMKEMEKNVAAREKAIHNHTAEVNAKEAQVSANMEKASEMLTESQRVADAWSKLPDGIMTVDHMLEFEDPTGKEVEKLKGKAAKDMYLRLRPSQWVNCTIQGAKGTNAAASNDGRNIMCVVKCTTPAVGDQPQKEEVFNVPVEELCKRDYCMRELATYFLGKATTKGGRLKEKRVTFQG